MPSSWPTLVVIKGDRGTGQPKIDEPKVFDSFVTRNDILRFDVPMNNPYRAQVMDNSEQPVDPNQDLIDRATETAIKCRAMN